MKIISRAINLIYFKQVLKYYAAGAIVNAGGYLLFLLLLSMGMEHKNAASLLYVMGSLISYWLNRKFVFNNVVSIKSGFLRLLLILLGGYLLNISALYIFVDVYSFHPGIVQLFSIFFASLYLYFANKFFVHRNSDR